MKACKKILECQSGDMWEITLVDDRSAKGGNDVSLSELKQGLFRNRGDRGLQRSLFALLLFILWEKTKNGPTCNLDELTSQSANLWEHAFWGTVYSLLSPFAGFPWPLPPTLLLEPSPYRRHLPFTFPGSIMPFWENHFETGTACQPGAINPVKYMRKFNFRWQEGAGNLSPREPGFY